MRKRLGPKKRARPPYILPCFYKSSIPSSWPAAFSVFSRFHCALSFMYLAIDNQPAPGSPNINTNIIGCRSAPPQTSSFVTANYPTCDSLYVTGQGLHVAEGAECGSTIDIRTNSKFPMAIRQQITLYHRCWACKVETPRAQKEMCRFRSWKCGFLEDGSEVGVWRWVKGEPDGGEAGGEVPDGMVEWFMKVWRRQKTAFLARWWEKYWIA